MKRITVLTLALALSTASLTATAAGWVAGYQNGDDVYTTKLQKDMELSLYCHGDDTAQSFFLSGKDPAPIATGAATDPEFKMVMTIDGHAFTAPFSGTSYATQSDYRAFWEAFRNAKNVSIMANGKEYNVPTEGLKETLPAYNSPEFTCGLSAN